MSDEAYQAALAEAQELTRLDEDELFEHLGLRIEDVKNPRGYQRASNFSADFQHAADDMFSVADLKRVGRLWWAKLEPELMKLVCVDNNADMSKITGGRTAPQVAASLATAAVISALAPPAWIIVATSILAAKIAETGMAAVCQTWAESRAEGSPSPGKP